jgi:hypothetical protein
MTCPPEVSGQVLDILRIGLLNITVFGSQGDASRCAAEAYHLHNLPSLLGAYSSGQLKYYIEVEQPEFVKLVGDDNIVMFEPHWEALRSFCRGTVD